MADLSREDVVRLLAAGQANFHGANLEGLDGRSLDWSGAVLTNARLAGADFRGARFDTSTRFDGADVSGADFRDAQIVGKGGGLMKGDGGAGERHWANLLSGGATSRKFLSGGTKKMLNKAMKPGAVLSGFITAKAARAEGAKFGASADLEREQAEQSDVEKMRDQALRDGEAHTSANLDRVAERTQRRYSKMF